MDPENRFKLLLGSSTDPLLMKLEDFKGTILILARSTQDGSPIAGPRDICELHKLEEEAAIALLRERLSQRSIGGAQEDQISPVVRSVACLPRAIIQLSSLLSNSGMQVTQLLSF